MSNSSDSSSDELLKKAPPPTGPSPNAPNLTNSTQNVSKYQLPHLSHLTRFDLAQFPTQDTIKLISAYLSEIIRASDNQTLLQGAKGDLTRFHARTVPGIDILAYLQRILRYAPCGNEVLLAVVVYLERLLRRAVLLLEAQKIAVNNKSVNPVENLEQAAVNFAINPPPGLGRRASVARTPPLSSPKLSRSASGIIAPTSPSRPHEVPSFSPATALEHGVYAPSPPSVFTMPTSSVTDPGLIELAMAALESTEFTMSKKRRKNILIVSSYNIHRLLITGVMVGSKLFSDVFFLNSHYAKVGGLPVPELNWLELEFVIFNDFKLHVPLDELQEMGEFLLSKAKDPDGFRNSVESGERWRLDKSIPVEIQFMRQMQVSHLSQSPTLAASPTPRRTPYSPNIHVPPRVPSPLSNSITPQTPGTKAAADFGALRISDETSHERAQMSNRWPKRDDEDGVGPSGGNGGGSNNPPSIVTSFSNTNTSSDTSYNLGSGQYQKHAYIPYYNPGFPSPRAGSPIREEYFQNLGPYQRSPAFGNLRTFSGEYVRTDFSNSYPGSTVGTPVGPLPLQPHLFACSATTPPPPSAGLYPSGFIPNGYFDPSSPLRSPLYCKTPGTPLDRSHSVPLNAWPPPLPGVAMERANSSDQPRKRAHHEHWHDRDGSPLLERDPSPSRNGSLSRNGHLQHPFSYSPYTTTLRHKHKTPPVSPRRGSVGDLLNMTAPTPMSPTSQSSNTALTSPSDTGTTSDGTVDGQRPGRHRASKSDNTLHLDCTINDRN